MSITLAMASATTSTRTEARAPHRRGLRLSLSIFSMRYSPNGTICRQASSPTLGNQTLAYGLRSTSFAC
jgi:hypothetical protein